MNKLLYLIVFTIVFLTKVNSQDKRIADSLNLRLSTLTTSDFDYLNTLSLLSYYETDPELAGNYADLLISEASAQGSTLRLLDGYLNKGTSQQILGEFENALESFFIGIKLSISSKNNRQEARFLSSIADIYSLSGNSKNANDYYAQAIDKYDQIKDSLRLATTYLNAGDELVNQFKYKLALEYFDVAEDIFSSLGEIAAKQYTRGNKALVYASTNKIKKAEKTLNEVILVLEKLEDYYGITAYSNYLIEILVKKGQEKEALSFSKKNLQIAKEYGLKNEISGAHQKLAEIHEHFGSADDAYHHYKAHIAMRDSINDIETVEALANQRTEFEVSQKQAEVEVKEQRLQTQNAKLLGTGVGAGLLSLMAVLLYRSNRFEKKTNKIIAEQKEKSENLLLNILPKETAEELKANGKVKAKRFESASVLFADFVGFTKFSKDMPPEKVVETIDRYFIEFDNIIDELGLEKIKTLGDGYMCAGGLPVKSDDHAVRLVRAAQKMKEYVTSKAADTASSDSFGIRIGIHSGPVVSGVVGSKKFAYDIWGDTVNTAARMESNSEPGKINVSKETYDLIKDEFSCTARGAKEVKGKGLMEMYFVEDTIRHSTTELKNP